jgi:hypothetical protein
MNIQTEPHIPDESIMEDFFLSEGFSDDDFYESLHLLDEAGGEKISCNAPFSILQRSPL